MIAAAQHDRGEGPAVRRHLGRRAEQPEQIGCVDHPEHAQHERQRAPAGNRLDGRGRRALGRPLADAPGHHGGGPHAEPDRDGEDERQQRIGQSQNGDRLRAEAADEVDVDDREHRLHPHFEDHRDGQQQHGATEAAAGVVTRRGAHGIAHVTPESRVAHRQRAPTVGNDIRERHQSTTRDTGDHERNAAAPSATETRSRTKKEADQRHRAEGKDRTNGGAVVKERGLSAHARCDVAGKHRLTS